jgi:hypothetical protein
MSDNTPLFILGGLGLLYLVYKSSPTTVAAQQAALAQTAALQSQQIATNANIQYVNTGANLIDELAGDFS